MGSNKLYIMGRRRRMTAAPARPPLPQRPPGLPSSCTPISHAADTNARFPNFTREPELGRHLTCRTTTNFKFNFKIWNCWIG